MDITREMLVRKVEARDWPDGGYVAGFPPMIGFHLTSVELKDEVIKIAVDTAWEIMNWAGDADVVCKTINSREISIKEIQEFLRGLFAPEHSKLLHNGLKDSSYRNGLECSWCGVAVPVMTREELIAFIGMMDAVIARKRHEG